MRQFKLILAMAVLAAFSSYGQVDRQDNPHYKNTGHRMTVGKITYFVFQYKNTGEYFIIMQNKKSGRTYWQPIEMVEPKETKKTTYDNNSTGTA